MQILLYPPFAFLITLVLILLFGKMIKSFEPAITKKPETSKTYACGEDFPAQKVSAGYEEFYPYAIFFTILHVAALMLMTLAFSSGVSFAVPLIYIITVLLIISILFI
ncbi:MAG: NADH-quinone oxidoreductase subunit A [Elusimicrobiota bacterium]